MLGLTLGLGLLASVLLLPTLTDLLARAREWRGRTRAAVPVPTDPPRLLFLVPAHDEELLILGCIRSLRSLRYPADRYSVIVIADNCHDRTAAFARSAGALCLERTDPRFPGKPHAIAWALTRLPWQAHDAVIIIDADSEVDPGFAVALARRAPLRDRAVQGYHSVLNRRESALTRLGAVLGAANHRFAYPAKQRGDLNTPLLGNGMSIGCDLLARHGWPAYTICEDWEMYAALTAAGVRIDGAPEAEVASQEARTLAQSASQRRRWTAGKLTVLVRYAAKLMTSPRIDLTQKLDALGELSAPGPAVHLGIASAGATLALLAPVPGGVGLAIALGGSLLRPAYYTVRAMAADPEPVAALGALASLPIYVVWRLVVALSSLAMLGDRPWVRTTRHQSSPPTVASRPL